jgi:hypothetical protein
MVDKPRLIEIILKAEAEARDRDELSSLRVSQVVKRAEEAGIPRETIQKLMVDKPRLIEVILKAEAEVGADGITLARAAEDEREKSFLVFKQINNQNCYLWASLLLFYNTRLNNFLSQDVLTALKNPDKRLELVQKTSDLNKNFHGKVCKKLNIDDTLCQSVTSHYRFDSQSGGNPLFIISLWLESMGLSYSLQPGKQVWIGLEKFFQLNKGIYDFSQGYFPEEPLEFPSFKTEDIKYKHVGGVIETHKKMGSLDGHATCFIYDDSGKRQVLETMTGTVTSDIIDDWKNLATLTPVQFSYINIFVQV